MTLWRSQNNAKLPYRVYTPDLHQKNPGYGAKAGIYGAGAQPAEYLTRYAWKRYGGTKKTRALAYYYQKDIRERYFRWRMYNYGNASSLSKNAKNASTYRKLQASSGGKRKLRWSRRKSANGSVLRTTSGYSKRRKSCSCWSQGISQIQQTARELEKVIS